MPNYVQAVGRDTWHWCSNCPNYPKNIGKRVTKPGRERPGSGELCNLCRDREKDGNCR